MNLFPHAPRTAWHRLFLCFFTLLALIIANIPLMAQRTFRGNFAQPAAKNEARARMIIYCKIGDLRQNCAGWGLCGLDFPRVREAGREGWLTANASLDGDRLNIEFTGQLPSTSANIEVFEDIVLSGDASARLNTRGLTVLKGVYDVDRTNPNAPKISLRTRPAGSTGPFVATADDYLKLNDIASDLGRFAILQQTLETFLSRERRIFSVDGGVARRGARTVVREMIDILSRLEKSIPALERYQQVVNERFHTGADVKNSMSPEMRNLLLTTPAFDSALNQWMQLNSNGTGFSELSNRIASSAPEGKRLLRDMDSVLGDGGGSQGNEFRLQSLWDKVKTWFGDHGPCLLSIGVFVGGIVLGGWFGWLAVGLAIHVMGPRYCFE